MSGDDASQEWVATRLVLIRHGESQVTVDRVIGGVRTCSGLSPLGRQQAERLHDRLADTGELAGGVLISSDFPRAIETAQLIAPAIVGAGSPSTVPVDPRFGERDPGAALDGVSFAEYVERYGHPEPAGEIFPGGESHDAFRDRVAGALADVVARQRGATVVICCHGGVIDLAFRLLLRLPPTVTLDLWTTNTSLTEFVTYRPDEGSTAAAGATESSRSARSIERWRLVRYNDAAHLAGRPAGTER